MERFPRCSRWPQVGPLLPSSPAIQAQRGGAVEPWQAREKHEAPSPGAWGGSRHGVLQPGSGPCGAALRPVQLGALCLVGLLTSACRPAPQTDLLLITVDTLRADRVDAPPGSVVVGPGSLGRGRAARLTEFAAGGLYCSHASTPRAKTTPALASLMTGLLPAEHAVRDLDTPLDAGFDTLAEALGRAGYDTAAIVANFVCVARRSGLDQGFDSFVEDLPSQNGIPEREGSSVTAGALAAYGLGAGSEDGAAPREVLLPGDRPSFLWLHYMDPHGPYGPPGVTPEALLALASDSPRLLDPALPLASGLRPWVADYNVPAAARQAAGQIDVGLVEQLYDAEVQHVDRAIGRLFDGLEAAGRLERMLVVVTADHGESLGEQNYWFEHGRNANEATCRIPLLLSWPGVLDAGIFSGDVSLVDLAPSLLELLGLPALVAPTARLAPGAEPLPRGRSYARAWRDGTGAEGGPGVSGEKAEGYELQGAVLLHSLRRGDYKLIRRSAFDGPLDSPDRRLRALGEERYHLLDDPYEVRPLGAEVNADGAFPYASAPAWADLSGELDGIQRASLEPARASTWLQRRDRARQNAPAADQDLLRRLGYVR